MPGSAGRKRKHPTKDDSVVNAKRQNAGKQKPKQKAKKSINTKATLKKKQTTSKNKARRKRKQTDVDVVTIDVKQQNAAKSDSKKTPNTKASQSKKETTKDQRNGKFSLFNTYIHHGRIYIYIVYIFNSCCVHECDMLSHYIFASQGFLIW